MGGATSDLSLEDMETLQNISNFSQKEIKRLYKRFKRLDKDGTAIISTDCFLSIPELAMNPLAPRIVAIFDENKDDQVNFKQFVRILSVFNEKASRLEKLSFTFKVYDINGDGFITGDELFQILKMMVGNNLSDTQLHSIVEKTILDADKDEDGKISFQEFSTVLDDFALETKLSIKFMN